MQAQSMVYKGKVSHQNLSINQSGDNFELNHEPSSLELYTDGILGNNYLL